MTKLSTVVSRSITRSLRVQVGFRNREGSEGVHASLVEEISSQHKGLQTASIIQGPAIALTPSMPNTQDVDAGGKTELGEDKVGLVYQDGHTNQPQKHDHPCIDLRLLSTPHKSNPEAYLDV